MGKYWHGNNTTVFMFKDPEVFKFNELKIGEKFIGFPMPGDDNAHGGFRGTFVIYEKIKGRSNKKFPELKYNAKRLSGSALISKAPSTWVIKVA